jgi:predicted DNA-binding antitoxin AbrB/MazE fold protein
MAKIIEAVYENGVFKPLQPVDLAEGQRVHVTLAGQPPPAMSPEEIQQKMKETHETFGQIPDAEWEEISQSWKRES